MTSDLHGFALGNIGRDGFKASYTPAGRLVVSATVCCNWSNTSGGGGMETIAIEVWGAQAQYLLDNGAGPKGWVAVAGPLKNDRPQAGGRYTKMLCYNLATLEDAPDQTGKNRLWADLQFGSAEVLHAGAIMSGRKHGLLFSNDVPRFAADKATPVQAAPVIQAPAPQVQTPAPQVQAPPVAPQLDPVMMAAIVAAVKAAMAPAPQAPVSTHEYLDTGADPSGEFPAPPRLTESKGTQVLAVKNETPARGKARNVARAAGRLAPQADPRHPTFQ